MAYRRITSPATRKFALRIALPAVVVLFSALGTVVYSLNQMAGDVDRTEQALTGRSVLAGIDAFVRRLGESHSDYARWDDAVRHLYGQADAAFIKENIAASTEAGTFFDAAFLLDEDGREVFGLQAGAPLSLTATEALGPAVGRLIDGLPKYDGTYAAGTGLLQTRWGPAAVAVGPVMPSSGEEPAPPRPRLLVLAKILDNAMLARIGSDRVVDGVRFVSSGSEEGVALIDPTGATIGRVTWSPRQTGSSAHRSLNRNVEIMLGLLIVTVAGMIAIAIRGVWKVERREEEARHAATHDQLTGLPNRATLMRELDAALASDPPRDTIAVLYVDLDGFKAVNDNYGHDTGDRVIKEIAVRFAAHCRDARLARLAGDEFAAFLSGQDVRKRAVEIGFALRREVEKPFDADGRITLRGASIGVSVSDADAKTAEELLRRADVAMYQAKQKQRGTLSVYDAAVDREMRERAWLAQQLRLAIREHRLEVVYQPVFNALTMEPVVVEALVRWTPGGLAPVPPMVFVSLAEETGLIDDLGAWILRRACEDARAWPDLRVAVNISPVQLRNPRFGAMVAGVLADTGMPAERLEVELTEGYLIEQPIQASETIDGLRAMGISIALDDFGTGYSSIGYLRQFRFDKLKLDSSMIDGIETATDVQRLVQATVALADALGLRVTAEGVQSDAAVVILRAAGCHELQGFHLGKPCPVEELWTLVGKPEADLRQGAA